VCSFVKSKFESNLVPRVISILPNLQFGQVIMNTSISRLLALSFYHSPMVASKKSLFLTNSMIYQSFNHFSFNNRNVHISKTSFHQFCNSVIRYDSKLYEFTGLITSHLPIPSYGQDIVVIDAVFEGCVSPIDGGAINHFSPDQGNLKIARSTFVECRGQKYPGDGGAVYFSGNSSEIKECCATRCHNYRNGHFICIALRGVEQTPNHFNSSTVTYCGFVKPNGWQTSYLSIGTIIVNDINTTHCSTSTQSSALFIHSIHQYVYARRLHVESNKGPWSIYFYAKFRAEILDSTFIDNENSNACLYYYKNGHVINCRFAKNKGPLIAPKSEDGTIFIGNSIFDVDFKPIKGMIFENNNVSSTNVKPVAIMGFHTHVCDRANKYFQ